MTNFSIHVLVACLALLEGGPGDAGLGRGELSMHRRAVQDVNRFGAVRLTVEDLEDPEVAIDAARVYVEGWVKDGSPAWRYAEVFNRGPSARRGRCRDYGRRLENLLEEFI